jgi:hypothetical protein
MNVRGQFYTLEEQTGYAEFHMPRVDAVASTWGGITFSPKPLYPFQKVITKPPATIRLPPTQIGAVGDC